MNEKKKEEKNEQKNEEKKKQYRLLIALAGLILAFVIGSIILQQCLDGSLLEYYGSVLTMTGTLILGAVTVWQTKKSLEVAEKSQAAADKANDIAEMVLDIEHRPDVNIETLYYDDALMKWGDLHSPSVHVLRLKKTRREENDLVMRKDIFYKENEFAKAASEAAKKLIDKPRKDLLFLEFHNDSNDPATIKIGQIRQFFQVDSNPYNEFDCEQEEFKSEGIPGKGSVKLVIRDAGRTDEKTQTYAHPWRLILPVSVTNEWKKETIEKTWEIKYMIKRVDGVENKQEYIITDCALLKDDVNTAETKK